MTSMQLCLNSCYNWEAFSGASSSGVKEGLQNPGECSVCWHIINYMMDNIDDQSNKELHGVGRGREDREG